LLHWKNDIVLDPCGDVISTLEQRQRGISIAAEVQSALVTGDGPGPFPHPNLLATARKGRAPATSRASSSRDPAIG
jgi:hypothetical protein